MLAVGKEADTKELLLEYYSDMLDVGDDEESVFWFVIPLAE